MKKILIVLVVWSAFAHAQGPGEDAKPLSRCDVLVYASFNGEGPQYLISAYRKPGVAFDVSDAFVADLKNSGASDELVAKLRKAVRSHNQPPFACKESVYSHVAAATRLTSANKLDEAQKQWSAALALEPRDPMLHVGLSMATGPHTSWRVAELEAQKAVHLKPELAIAHSQKAATLTMLAYQGNSKPVQLNLARQEYQEAVRLAPKNCYLHANFGVTLIALEDYAGGEKQADIAEQQCPKLTFPMYVRANSLAEQGKRKDAITHLRSAVEIQPNNCILWTYMISLLKQDGETADALKASTQAAQHCQ